VENTSLRARRDGWRGGCIYAKGSYAETKKWKEKKKSEVLSMLN
jgi:hypothetical protein